MSDLRDLAFELSLPAGEYVGTDAQVSANASLAGIGLPCEPYRLALEFIVKPPSFHLLRPIIESALSKVSVLAVGSLYGSISLIWTLFRYAL